MLHIIVIMIIAILYYDLAAGAYSKVHCLSVLQ